ncbi:Mcm2-7 hexameric complex component [Balamuthia mandrillaris]
MAAVVARGAGGAGSSGGGGGGGWDATRSFRGGAQRYGRGGGGGGRGGGGGGWRNRNGFGAGGGKLNAAATKKRELPDYLKEKEKCIQLLETYSDSETERRILEGEDVPPKYVGAMMRIVERQDNSIVIDVGDVLDFMERNIRDPAEQEEWRDFARNITRNAQRYHRMFAEAVDELLAGFTPSDDVEKYQLEDVVEVLRMHRENRALLPNTTLTMNLASGDAGAAHSEQPVPDLPKALTRRFELRVVPSSKERALPLRKVRAIHIGSLVTVKGIITRVTQVKPLVTVVTYTCDRCGEELYQEVHDATFMPLQQCSSRICMQNQIKGKLYMQTRGSKFIKYQELRLQELAEEVPMGDIPCSLLVRVRGELTRMCSPGDVATISGIYLPVIASGFNAMRSGLVTDTYLEATNIAKMKKNYSDYHITPEMEQRIETLAQSPNAYSHLASCLAPEIYGHEDVKKALLLLMVGGVTRNMPDGMKIRGDINVCLMGDPGVAKSQLLKHISVIAPRAVYTSGKGSSGVGLTAAVIRDTTTNEMILEGGALVLADMGVCCIDEFDKMEDSDRTAIHEVMEQQTISIAKAGIATTLNARTAILAAANPAFGRYNIKRTPEENINLPAALLSRFDLLFLLLDRPSRETDMALARHIGYVHRTGHHPPSSFFTASSSMMEEEEGAKLAEEYRTPEFIRAYIAVARRFEPMIPQHLTDYLVDAYVNMRSTEAAMDEEAHSYTTARTLLAILRLSQALARIRLSEEVCQEDVEEAMRLMFSSKASLEDKKSGGAGKNGMDPISAIYTIIRDCSTQKESLTVLEDEVVPMVLAKGYTQQQFEECVAEYEDLNIWCHNRQKREIRFVNS